MGRNFTTELQELEATYKWAIGVPIEPLTAAISASAPYSLVSVGSGGSFTAAHLACVLHQKYTGKVSKPMTPLEFVSSRFDARSIAMMVLSAAGSNKDIISAAEYAAFREPRRCIFFCLRKGSALSRVSNSFNLVDHIELSPPSAKDGFLSTNSLLAFSTLLIRSYDEVFSSNCGLPKNFHNLVPDQHLYRDPIVELITCCEPLWERDTLIVLYGPSVTSAAIDIESKFTEAALGNVQLADFRNFAHGRHHWLAKRESSTGILALYTHDERRLAQRTLKLIPPKVPRIELCIPFAGPLAMLSSLVVVLHLVASAGRYRGIDPGRPGVPAFGRRIYSLRNSYDFKNKISLEQIALARKLGCDVRDVTARHDFRLWQAAYARFIERLAAATFSGFILDYDGTLCGERDRFNGLSNDIVPQLIRLLRKGIIVGVATGRGKSVKEDLRKHIPVNLWDKIYIGYYNGSIRAELGNEDLPESSTRPTGLLKKITTDISNHPILANHATWKSRKTQVSVYPISAAFTDTIWRILQQLSAPYGLKMVKSSHSVDIIQKGTSKRSLLTHIRTLVGKDAQILSIGDKGQWPGNDYELLSTSFSLSVDEVSADPDTCWNLAPAGHRGVQATVDYLKAFKVVAGLATLNGEIDFRDERSYRATNEKRTRATSSTNNLA